jgi:hypothetical protein
VSNLEVRMGRVNLQFEHHMSAQGAPDTFVDCLQAGISEIEDLVRH